MAPAHSFAGGMAALNLRFRVSWSRRPGEGGFLPVAGQPDPGDEPAVGAQGVLDEAGINVAEAELAAADQPHRAVVVNVAPGEKEVAVGAVAAHGRPAEVEAVRAAR